MENMFNNASSFEQNIQQWSVNDTVNTSLMFSGATNMINTYGSSSGFSSSPESSFFNKVDQLTDSNIASVIRAYVENPNANEFTEVTNGPYYGSIENWDTSLVTNMSYIFENQTTFTGNISKWNTSNVTSMDGMFYGASSFNSDLNPIGVEENNFINPVYNSWDTSNVTSMTNMFYNANQFNGIMNLWNTSNVVNMYGMFHGASKFNQYIGRYNDANTTTNENGQDVTVTYTSWDTSKVTNMEYMFYDATAFSCYNIIFWLVPTNLSSTYMFTENSVFYDHFYKYPNFNANGSYASPDPSFFMTSSNSKLFYFRVAGGKGGEAEPGYNGLYLYDPQEWYGGQNGQMVLWQNNDDGIYSTGADFNFVGINISVNQEITIGILPGGDGGSGSGPNDPDYPSRWGPGTQGGDGAFIADSSNPSDNLYIAAGGGGGTMLSFTTISGPPAGYWDLQTQDGDYQVLSGLSISFSGNHGTNIYSDPGAWPGEDGRNNVWWGTQYYLDWNAGSNVVDNSAWCQSGGPGWYYIGSADTNDSSAGYSGSSVKPEDLVSIGGYGLTSGGRDATNGTNGTVWYEVFNNSKIGGDGGYVNWGNCSSSGAGGGAGYYGGGGSGSFYASTDNNPPCYVSGMVGGSGSSAWNRESVSIGQYSNTAQNAMVHNYITNVTYQMNSSPLNDKYYTNYKFEDPSGLTANLVNISIIKIHD